MKKGTETMDDIKALHAAWEAAEKTERALRLELADLHDAIADEIERGMTEAESMPTYARQRRALARLERAMVATRDAANEYHKANEPLRDGRRRSAVTALHSAVEAIYGDD